MGEVIGDVLPLALGVALSPVPVIAVILMLLSPRARASGVAFASGWLVGVAAVATVVTVLVHPAGATDSDDQSILVPLLKLGLGVLCLALGVREWRSRPREGDVPELPGWMSAVDRMTPVKAAGLGAALGGVNPKNLTLCVSAGATVGGAALAATDTAIVLAVFVVLASITVAAPVVAYLLARDAMQHPLEELRTWLTANSSTVLAVLMLVIGVVLVGKGVGGL